MILVTGATGMFGGAITGQLAERGAAVRAMTSNPDRAAGLRRAGVEPVVADMDRPETLDAALAGIDAVFVVSPMDERVRVREGNVLEAAVRHRVGRIVKLHGAVRHDDDLGRLHGASIEAIRNSGLEWALLSPTSVIETTLFSSIPWIEETGGIVASAGEGRVAHVALRDVAQAGAVVLTDGFESGREYVITGPKLLSLGELCEILSRVTGRSIPYTDVPDAELARVLVQEAGMTPEQAEVGVICHFRAWRNGEAEALTDTFRELTGRSPTSAETWIEQHSGVFAEARAKAPAG